MGSSSDTKDKAEIKAAHDEGITVDDKDLSSKYETPQPEPVASFAILKERIRHHYELASDYYYSLW